MIVSHRSEWTLTAVLMKSFLVFLSSQNTIPIHGKYQSHSKAMFCWMRQVWAFWDTIEPSQVWVCLNFEIQLSLSILKLKTSNSNKLALKFIKLEPHEKEKLTYSFNLFISIRFCGWIWMWLTEIGLYIWYIVYFLCKYPEKNKSTK